MPTTDATTLLLVNALFSGIAALVWGLLAGLFRIAPQASLLLAGAYHVRKDLGVPLHLADLQAQGESKVLLLAEVGEQVEAGEADFVWYTAAMPEQDYCAQLR